MLLCAISLSCCAFVDGGAGAVSAVFAFLTDLYLEYFAGVGAAAAGALSLIVVMAGLWRGYCLVFVRRFRKIVRRAQCIAGPV